MPDIAKKQLLAIYYIAVSLRFLFDIGKPKRERKSKINKAKGN